MTHVSIIGTGNMGSAIASVVTQGGNTAELLGQDDSGKPVTGDVVVLAVPYPAVADIVAQRGEKLAGKVVVNITNPLDFVTFDSLVVPADSSATAEIAVALPQSRVVKAFNTTFAATLASGTVGDNLVTAASLGAIDTGALKRDRELDAVGFLQIGLAAAEKVAWTGGFAVVR